MISQQFIFKWNDLYVRKICSTGKECYDCILLERFHWWGIPSELSLFYTLLEDTIGELSLQLSLSEYSLLYFVIFSLYICNGLSEGFMAPFFTHIFSSLTLYNSKHSEQRIQRYTQSLTLKLRYTQILQWSFTVKQNYFELQWWKFPNSAQDYLELNCSQLLCILSMLWHDLCF